MRTTRNSHTPWHHHFRFSIVLGVILLAMVALPFFKSTLPQLVAGIEQAGLEAFGKQPQD